MDRLSPPATGAAGRCAGRDGSGPAAACEEVTAACPRGDEATRGCERALPRTRRSAAAHDRAPPTPGAGAGRGDTGPRGCGRNRAHSTKRPMHVRRAERPAIAVRTARPPRGIGAGHERGAPMRGQAHGRAARGGPGARKAHRDPAGPRNGSSPRRRRRGLDRSREVRSAADAEHLRAADRAGALGGGLAVLHRDLLRVLHLALCLALDAIRLGHSGSLPFVTVDVVGPLARRSSVTSDTGSAQPSVLGSSNPTDPGRRELAQR